MRSQLPRPLVPNLRASHSGHQLLSPLHQTSTAGSIVSLPNDKTPPQNQVHIWAVIHPHLSAFSSSCSIFILYLARCKHSELLFDIIITHASRYESSNIFFFFFFFNYLFIYLFLAALGLHCSAWAFL